MAKNRVDYLSRDFSDIRVELQNFVRTFYPESFSDFSDSSVGTILLELNAAVGDILSFHTDRIFQETQLNQAQQRESLFELSSNRGFKIPPRRAAATVVDVTVNVPVAGDTFSTTYLPVLKAGTQVTGNNVIFEFANDVDFSETLSSLGTPNRIIIPVTTNNNTVQSYNITKRELVFNFVTRTNRVFVTSEAVQQFFEYTLPQNDVLSIDSIIELQGNVANAPTDAEFNNQDIRFFEVESLNQPQVFLETSRDESGLSSGRWQDVNRKFVKEFTPNGNCTIRFGSGTESLDGLTDALQDVQGFDRLRQYLFNDAFGEAVKANRTYWIKYKTGGGQNGNVGVGAINRFGTQIIENNGPRQDIRQQVNNSLNVTNIIPAFGGKDEFSNEEIRNLVRFNFASQNRCVTLRDYLLKVNQLPGKFGSPFKVTTFKENNKVIISILGLSPDGNLDNQSTSTLKQNIAEWLSEFRMINDFVQIRDGRIYNLAYDIEVLIDDENISSTQIVNSIVNTVSEFHNIQSGNMNQNILLGNLTRQLDDIPGISNITDLKVFNKVGQDVYSVNEIEQPLINTDTRQIKVINNTLFASKDSMFEVRFPNRDVRVTTRRIGEIINSNNLNTVRYQNSQVNVSGKIFTNLQIPLQLENLSDGNEVVRVVVVGNNSTNSKIILTDNGITSFVQNTRVKNIFVAVESLNPRQESNINFNLGIEIVNNARVGDFNSVLNVNGTLSAITDINQL